MLSQLRDLDLQLLRLFVTVVECGGFSAAQGELGIGQSTISTQMAKLETRLGFRLCERGKAGFRLTPKGEQVLSATRKLFSAIDTFKGEAQGMADMLLGELRIGLSEGLAASVLEQVAEAIRQFRSRKQQVQIELITAMPAELERRLLQDQLHLAIGYFSGNQSALTYQPLFRERQMLYCAQGHPFYGRQNINPVDLQQADRVHHPYRFVQAREPLQGTTSSAQTEQVDGALAFILSGQHIGYLPEHIAAPWQHSARLWPIDPESLAFEVQFHLTSHRGQHPSDAQRAFADDLLRAFNPGCPHSPDATG
jgi:LysR family transcriptional regulator, transcriptional activator for bauABCD operon